MDEEYNLPLNSNAIGLRGTIDTAEFDLTEFEAQVQPKSDVSDRSELIEKAIAEVGDEDSMIEDDDDELGIFDENDQSSKDGDSSHDEIPVDISPLIAPTAAVTAAVVVKDSVKHIKNCQEIKEKLKALTNQNRISGSEYNMKRIESDPEYAANVNQTLHDIFERDNRCDSCKNFLVCVYRGIESICDGEMKILGKTMPNLKGLGDELEAQASTPSFKHKAGAVVDLVNDKLGSNILDALQTVAILGMPFVRTYQNNLKRDAGERVLSSNSDINDLEDESVW